LEFAEEFGVIEDNAIRASVEDVGDTISVGDEAKGDLRDRRVRRLGFAVS
jgi:hypothetical protein